MPYKDLDKRRANQRAWVRQKRIDRRIDRTGIDRAGIDTKSVRPKPEKPAGISDNQWAYIQSQERK